MDDRPRDTSVARLSAQFEPPLLYPGRKPTQVGNEPAQVERGDVLKIRTLDCQVRTNAPLHLGKESFLMGDSLWYLLIT